MIRRWLVRLALLVFAMVAASGADEARATTYSDGRHWNDRTVYVVDLTGGNQTDYPVAEAVRRLNYSRGPYLSFRTTVPTWTTRYIVVRRATLSTNVAGVAQVWLSGGHIVKGDVRLSYATDYKGYLSMEVTLHELGHALGLAHTSYTGASVMQPIIRYPYSTWPSTYDKADLARLYPY